MKIKRLDLKAFGPFADRVLEFDSEKPGLHIIFGHNEAGKSSTLRALKALLYGFPERTADNFRHPNDQLLVGGCLEGADGEELVFSRRKKRKGDLLDSAGNPMDPGALAAFLHGIDPTLFESLYGIDHKTLVMGGEDILAQKGDVGQALFAAGAGISSLKKILDSFEAEANELFRNRGSKQLINAAISEYKNLKKVVRELSLPASKWKEHRKLFKEAEATYQQLDQEIKEKRNETHRLERLARAVPELAKLYNLRSQVAELGDVVNLPQDFADALHEVKQGIREAKLRIESAQNRKVKLEQKQGDITLNQALLDHATIIQDLYERLGAFRKGQKDRDTLNGRRAAIKQEAGKLIEAIRPDLTLNDADSLRPVLNRKKTIQELSSQKKVVDQQALQTRKQKEAAEREIEKITKSLQNMPEDRDSEGLKKAVRLVQKAGELDVHIAEINRETIAGTKSCQSELKRLGLWVGKLAELPELSLPQVDTIRRFETGFADLANEKRQLKKDRRKAESDLESARVDYNEIAYGVEVPSEQDLEVSRQKRQAGWQLLRRQWLNGDDVTQETERYAPGRPLHEAYESHVDQADTIADRLRREADRVTKAAALKARIEGFEIAIKELIRETKECAGREEALAAKWQTEWKSAGITPQSPQEMLTWLDGIEKLRSRVTEIRNKEDESRVSGQQRQKYRQALIDELKSLGENQDFPGLEIEPVLVFAETVVDTISQQKAAREKLSGQQNMARDSLAKAGKELDETKQARDEWQIQWDKSLAGLGMKEQLLPSEALDVLESISDCLAKLQEVKEIQSRIDGIDRDNKKYTAEVESLVTQVSPDLKALPVEEVARRLFGSLDEARQAWESFRKNSEDIEGLSADIDDAQKALESFEARMAEHLATAKCDTAAQLPEEIRKSDEYKRLSEKISDAESSLATISEGVPEEQIRLDAAEIDIDALPGQIEALNRQIDGELQPRIEEALKRIGEEKKELDLMDGSGNAAEAVERLEQVAARIRRLVDRYTKIKLASKVLQDEIERYREEHQGPVLQIASGIFSELTQGSFAGLRTDVDDSGNPILIGVREDDARVKIDGMSDGTCDQLYLALRLATLKARVETAEPMPFIVDDILINFDDERSKATLEALADLSENNQVILFTHHKQVVDTAEKMKGHSIHVHEL